MLAWEGAELPGADNCDWDIGADIDETLCLAVLDELVAAAAAEVRGEPPPPPRRPPSDDGDGGGAPPRVLLVGRGPAASHTGSCDKSTGSSPRGSGGGCAEGEVLEGGGSSSSSSASHSAAEGTAAREPRREAAARDRPLRPEGGGGEEAGEWAAEEDWAQWAERQRHRHEALLSEVRGSGCAGEAGADAGLRELAATESDEEDGLDGLHRVDAECAEAGHQRAEWALWAAAQRRRHEGALRILRASGGFSELVAGEVQPPGGPCSRRSATEPPVDEEQPRAAGRPPSRGEAAAALPLRSLRRGGFGSDRAEAHLEEDPDCPHEPSCSSSASVCSTSAAAWSSTAGDPHGHLMERVQRLQQQYAEHLKESAAAANPRKSALACRVAKMISEEQEKQAKELTFRPSITAAARRAAAAARARASVETPTTPGASVPAKPLFERRMAQMRDEQREREAKACTFKPHITPTARKVERRHVAGPPPEPTKQFLEARIAKMKAEQREKEERECTFKPRILRAQAQRPTQASPAASVCGDPVTPSRRCSAAGGGAGPAAEPGRRPDPRAARGAPEVRQAPPPIDPECTFRPRLSDRSRKLCRAESVGQDKDGWHERLSQTRPRSSSAKLGPRPQAGAPPGELAKVVLDIEGFNRFLSILAPSDGAAGLGALSRTPRSCGDGVREEGEDLLAATAAAAHPLPGDGLRADDASADSGEELGASSVLTALSPIKPNAVRLTPTPSACSLYAAPAFHAVHRRPSASILDDAAWCLQMRLKDLDAWAEPAAFFQRFSAGGSGELGGDEFRRVVREEMGIGAGDLPEADLDCLVDTLARLGGCNNADGNAFLIQELVDFVQTGATALSPNSSGFRTMKVFGDESPSPDDAFAEVGEEDVPRALPAR